MIWISLLWSNLAHLITLYSCNRNVTLKMAGIPAEKCRCKYHNKITPVELGAFCWSLIHFIQISALNMERIKKVCNLFRTSDNR
jgi:hypothetical protein